MLVIYRTNEGFAGDVVTVMTGDADLTAALVGADFAVLSLELPAADAAALIRSPDSYVVENGLLCERKGKAEELSAKRADAEITATEKLTVSAQVAAKIAMPVDVEPVSEETPATKP